LITISVYAAATGKNWQEVLGAGVIKNMLIGDKEQRQRMQPGYGMIALMLRSTPRQRILLGMRIKF
jgi:hypothetical protein